MKKTEIILILVVAIIIGIILSHTLSASIYITFTDAEKRMGREYTVIGELIKEKEIRFEPRLNLLTFYASDSLKTNEKFTTTIQNLKILNALKNYHDWLCNRFRLYSKYHFNEMPF